MGMGRGAGLLLALEPRMMFDGAAVATALANDDHGDTQTDSAPDAAPAPAESRREVAFVDADIADWQGLAAGLPADITVHVLEAGRDGLAQMAEILAGERGLDAIHLFSHGSDGALILGSATLDTGNLGAHTAELAAIGGALTADGDLMLYGCDVGAGEDGQAFLAGLAAATGADLAASTDATGAIERGGDWELEARQGAVDSVVLTSAGFQGILAPADQLIIGDGGGGGGGGGGATARGGAGGSGGGGNDTITGSGYDDAIYGDGSGGGGGGGGAGSPFVLSPSGGQGGAGGGGADVINGGAGNDIIFGDGFGGASGSDGGYDLDGYGGVGGLGGFGIGGAGGIGGGIGSDGEMGQGGAAAGWGGSSGGEAGYDGADGGTAMVVLSAPTAQTYLRTTLGLATILTTYSSYGAGTDVIDGGAGNDDLFGLGGDDTFVFERSDAGASDADTVWDFNRNGESDKLKLTVGGQALSASTVAALVAAQTTAGADRSIVFASGANQVTILVKGLGRNLAATDFVTGTYGDASTTSTEPANRPAPPPARAEAPVEAPKPPPRDGGGESRVVTVVRNESTTGRTGPEAGTRAFTPAPGSDAGRPATPDTLVAVRPTAEVQAVDGRVSFTLPPDTFAATRPDSQVSLRATTADGQPLPAWLRFNPETGRFEGEPPPGAAGEVVVRVVARDQDGTEAAATLRITVAGKGQRSGSLEVPRVGKLAFTEQLRAAQRHPTLSARRA
jgi:hypothetical protein